MESLSRYINFVQRMEGYAALAGYKRVRIPGLDLAAEIRTYLKIRDLPTPIPEAPGE